MEIDKIGEINQKIAEIKKRILLVEGQKTANTAEWQSQSGINCQTIAALKKEIKELLIKSTQLKNPLQRPIVLRDSAPGETCKTSATPILQVGRASYPMGAKTPDDAVFLTDLKLTESRKQLDLLRHRLICKQQRYVKLAEEYQALRASKKHQDQVTGGEKPPETAEEEADRRLVSQLENEIHRTNVQWMEAEHVCKKYKSMQASLMTDAERFERSLKELKEALNEQQAETNRLQEVHTEAIEKRDAAKVALQRQEQQAHLSQKMRERQAFEYRKQLEMRKMELERMGRRLFYESRTESLTHEDSIATDSGDQSTGNPHPDDPAKDSNSQLQSVTTEMDDLFKVLMEVTGAISPQEVLERFNSQKESASRLNYLRKVAEAEKSELEAQRDRLTRELEASRFSDVQESDVNQEVIDKIKADIRDFEAERQKSLEAAAKSAEVLKYLQERLHEMIYRLQEVDEGDIVLEEKNIRVKLEDFPSFLVNEASDADLIEILKLKLRSAEELSKHEEKPSSVEKLAIETNGETSSIAEQNKASSTSILPEGEKPQSIPACYFNLLGGRGQRAAGTLSSSPDQAAAAVPTDEESEVPSRTYLKRQSVLVVETKSRRKPYRSSPAVRRK